MNTTFLFRERELHLIRYPAQSQHVSLQAWDSADELLIDYITESITPARLHNMVIINDDFGTLGCWFAEVSPHWLSDSWIAHRSLRENLLANGQAVQETEEKLVRLPVTATNGMSPMPESPSVVVIKIPRTLNLLEHQLIELMKVATPHTTIIAAGKVKSITRNVLNLFEKYVGPVTTSLAKKKSRLIFATPTQEKLATVQRSPFPIVWHHSLPDGQRISVSNHANVFSGQSLDIGARIMLEHLQVEPSDHVVDLGCGNGILGLSALSSASGVKVSFVDESFMALASAEKNVQDNFPAQLSDCRFIASNCLEELFEQTHLPPVTKVVCNPPFHQQSAITDHIAWQMFHDSKRLLTQGGHLIVVGNRHLDYHAKLKRLFGGVKLIASNHKFVILCAAKR
ncbi:methyltransferase [Alteromonas ponticola]|uniref:Ribosomal RNA large subunit methyltransferase G n=1 Tax=Alteromonas aquimaris TaxID=2998417 RepID=A0ABT3P9C5_9ALTE|nr:methyltransferase [Alteromonas aquimaris]MCW8109376.1 methyltransferase [Alteromonas aquimaris]